MTAHRRDGGPLLGVVADDVTGACDLAGGVVAAGLSAVVVLGPPDTRGAPAADVLVVALKSRTAPVDQAVSASRTAASWLLGCGARWVYQKYCSTFDSTDAGNIGPVADALADLVAAHRTGAGPGRPGITVGTPATPAVGRTQYLGHLFVHGRPLPESSMRHHPLTPMRDADLARVLGRQTSRPVGVIGLPEVRGGAAPIRAAVDRAAAGGCRHLLLDATQDDDLDAAAAALTGPAPGGTLEGAGVAVVLGGGAGLATALARRWAADRATSPPGRPALPAVGAGGRLVLAGSLSERTREQAAHFPGPAVTLDARRAHHDADGLVGELLAAVRQALGSDPAGPVLVHSTATPDELAHLRADVGTHAAAAAVERVLGAVARRAVAELGVRRLLVAGGETAGAVTAALGVTGLHVGREVGPGVPWTVTTGEPRLGLLLKSGNFGPVDLFTSAWRTAP